MLFLINGDQETIIFVVSWSLVRDYANTELLIGLKVCVTIQSRAVVRDKLLALL